MATPPRIQQLLDDLQRLASIRGVIGARVRWARNAEHEIVIALIAPADFAATSVRDGDDLGASPRPRNGGRR